jgi:glycosyltransferase involved in cell wall biosynthesis
LRSPWGLGAWDLAHAHEGRGVYLAWWLKKTRGFPYVITRRLQQAPKSRLLTRAAYRSADVIVGISTAAREALEEFLPGSDIGQVASVYSGAPPDDERARNLRAAFVSQSDDILIGHAGALVDRHKGQRVLIEACRRLRGKGYPIRLLMLGEGPDRDALEDEVRDAPWVWLPGEKTPVIDYLGGLDIFCFPSRHEGLGSVLLEAIAAGAPVIASAVGGIPDLIDDERTGLLVTPGDAAALESAIERFINDRAFAKGLAEQAKKSVLGLHTPAKMHDEYCELYRSVR